MDTLPVFYQAENLPRVEHATFSADATLAEVLADIRQRHALPVEVVLFLEDADEPSALTARLRDLGTAKGLKIHVHRCLHVEVSVSFNGRTDQRRFSPSTTVARVKRWATEKPFPMSPEQAAEHVLQLVGSTDRPSPGTHLGTLATHPHCQVRFDLVPNERVNGAPDA